MATYKVIQDIEAEDKLLGPFSLRQFVYLIIVFATLFVGYRLVLVQWFLALPLLPIVIFFGLLSLPFGREQSTEIWLLAKIRFVLKPKIRVWDQSGLKELVTITAPKKIEKHLTKELSQIEVRSRLEALANTIDTRGWAIKNVDVNLFAQPALAGAGDSDRLVNISAMALQDSGLTVNDGILDEQNNPTAQNLDRMIHASTKAHRDKLVSQMKQATQIPPSSGGGSAGAAGPPASQSGAPGGQPSAQPDYWLLNATGGNSPPAQPGMSNFGSNIVTPNAAAGQPSPPSKPSKTTQPLTEEELLQKIHAQKEKPKNYGHLRVIKPIEEQQAEAAAAANGTKPQEPPVTPAPDPAILGLANNDDLNVATIAHEANKQAKKGKKPPEDEVVISLH